MFLEEVKYIYYRCFSISFFSDSTCRSDKSNQMRA